jgi:CubicO group peptidase (beta-lactamase class C family)
MRYDRGIVKPLLSLLLSAMLLFSSADRSASAGASPELTPPESVGFSSQRLKRLEDMIQQYIDSKELPGAVTMLARHGKLVECKTYGKKDLTSGAPVEKNSIFRIFSMTKPVTGVAMMMLYEEGKWRPEDPLTRFIPEFKDLKVFKGTDAEGKLILETPVHPPTVGELLSHTAGFTYGLFGATPVDKMYVEKGVLDSHNLQEMIGKLSTIPLLYQPGS